MIKNGQIDSILFFYLTAVLDVELSIRLILRHLWAGMWVECRENL